MQYDFACIAICALLICLSSGAPIKMETLDGSASVVIVGASSTDKENAMPECSNCENACDKPNEECCICRDTSKYSGMTMNGGMAYCDECRERSNRQAEAAAERFMEDFYGSSQPVTIQEQYVAAAEQKRRLG